MTLVQLERFVRVINGYHEREEELSKALGPFNSSYTEVEFYPGMVSTIMDYIKEEFKDEDDWFGYWFYELDQGRNKELGASYKDGTPIKLDTLEDVYNFMVS